MTIQKNTPYSLSRRGKFYQVRFKDESTGKYGTAISTGQTSEEEARNTVLLWRLNGQIERKTRKQSLKAFSLGEYIRRNGITDEELKEFLKIAKQRGKLKSYVIPNDKNDVDFCQFLLDFWKWDSPYIKDRLRMGKSIGKSHVIKSHRLIELYWSDFFKGKLLGEVSRGDLKEFLNEKLFVLPISNSTKNQIINAGIVPLKYAYEEDYISEDITKGFSRFNTKSAEKRNILSYELAQAVFHTEWDNPKAYLANLLAMCTGMRSGEIQALRKQDLGENCIYVKHSWNEKEGLKSTKNREERTVQLPFPGLGKKLLEMAETNPFDKSMSAFVFYSSIPNKPMEGSIFVDELRKALLKIDVSEEESKKYVFHSWRHFYATYMKDNVSNKLLKSQTGHKTDSMLDLYSNHQLAKDAEIIQNAQIEKFGEIIKGADVNIDIKQLYRSVPLKYMDKSGLYDHSRQDR